MSERISEDNLRAAAAAARLLLHRREDVLSLVDEVRRLRGLIIAADADPLREDQTGRETGPLYDELMHHKAAVRALSAEAEAIRAEGEKLCTCVPSFEGFDGRCRNCRERA